MCTEAGGVCVHTGRAKTWNVGVHTPQCRRPIQDINRSHWEALNSSRRRVCAQQFPPAGRGWIQERVGEKILSQRHPLASRSMEEEDRIYSDYRTPQRGPLNPHIWTQLFWNVFHSAPSICTDGGFSSVTGGAQILWVNDLPKCSRKLAPFLWR